jgi:hypothetical protein
VFAKDIIGEH